MSSSGPKLGLSLEKFARAKRYDPRKVEQLKRQESIRKAKALRGYKRLLKKEGYEEVEDEPDTGESGKRKRHPEDNKSEDKSNGKKRRKPFGKDKEKKVDPFLKAKEEAAKRAQAEKEKAEEEARRKEEQKRKQEERKRWSRKLKQKNRKGQPILKHKINHILDKLEKQAK